MFVAYDPVTFIVKWTVEEPAPEGQEEVMRNQPDPWFKWPENTTVYDKLVAITPDGPALVPKPRVTLIATKTSILANGLDHTIILAVIEGELPGNVPKFDIEIFEASSGSKLSLPLADPRVEFVTDTPGKFTFAVTDMRFMATNILEVVAS
jgi:hypothetical protein